MSTQTSPSTSATRFARETTGQVAEATHRAVDEHPLQAGLFVFAAGLAAGTLIGYALAGNSRSTHSQLAESLGSRLIDGMAHVVPEALTKRFHG